MSGSISPADSERYHRALLAHKGALWDISIESGRFFCSEGFWTLIGLDSEASPTNLNELLGIIREDDRSIWENILRTPADETEQPYECEFRVRLRPGEHRWLLSSGQVIFGGNGKPERVVGFTREITSRRQAKEALERSEESLKEAQRIAGIGSWSLDLASEEVIWSDELFHMFGMPLADQAPSLSDQSSLFSPDSWALLNDSLEQATQAAKAYEIELKFKRQDGADGWLRARGEPVKRDGVMTGLRGVAQDITEEKIFREQLAEQAALIDKAPVAFVVQDLQHRIIYWSAGAERVYGLKSGAVFGKSWIEITQFDANVLVEAKEQLMTRGDWHGHFAVHRPSGGRVAIESRWTLLRDDEGNPISILTIDSDVSQAKEIEAQLMRAQRMDSIGTLAGGIAHDLNNVLAPVLMGMAVLRRKLEDPQSLSVIDSIESSANRGADLVKQVLSFARGVDSSETAVQIRHLVNDLESVIENTFPKNIEFESDLDQELWLVKGDATQLHQIFLNLCVNARDAMPDGGSLTLRAKNQEIDAQYAAMAESIEPGNYVCLEVTDSGFGMSPEVQREIFEPFFTTKEKDKGTGIGLSTVKAILENHQGAIMVDSTLDKGSTFTVFLPAAEQDAIDSDSSEPKAEITPGNGELILVAEDEASVRNITKQTLEAFGYRVITADDGAQAIAAYAKNLADIALVLTDTMMPVMDGVALLAAIRRINPQARVIVTSGSVSDEAEVKRVAENADEFLVKPYSANQLLKIVNATLARP